MSIKCPKCKSANVAEFCADCGTHVNANSPSLWALSECLSWAENRHGKAKADDKVKYYAALIVGLKSALRYEQARLLSPPEAENGTPSED